MRGGNRRALIGLTLLAAVLLGACGRTGPAPGAAAGAPRAAAGARARPAAPAPDLQRTTPMFYEAEQFQRGLREAGAKPPPRGGPGPVVGGLVPHHILAGHLMTYFFLELEHQPPKTLIVVGPNHENRGQTVVTGRRGWATDFGVAEADQNLVDLLVASGLAAEDDEALSEEHSVGALMPYLKYHAPKARVLPIILHRDVPVETLQRLTDWLAEIVGPGRILLASVDFSHYLTRPEADKKDEITLQAIEAFDLDALRRMGPDHLDSPGSLSLLMLTMRKLRAAGPEMVGRDNSGSIIGNDLIETTSYFTFKFRLPNPGR